MERNKKLDVYIVGKCASGKSQLRRHILEVYKPTNKTEINVHTVQCDPDELSDVTFSDHPILFNDKP